MDAVIYAHHYEETAVFLHEDWVTRASHNPQSDNPNRWWNDGRSLPKNIK
jgi:hypothetical protein